MVNKENNESCQHCGKPLGPKVIQGMCPGCLFKIGLGSVEGDSSQAQHFDAPPPEDLADLFPQLDIQELIGVGGMGAVYRARQRDLDRPVALKILAPRGKDDPSFTERFTREARALARLSHPHIVAVHDFGHAGDLYYFIMEFVDGTNLRQIQQAGRLSPEEALAIIPQICAALQYAHDQDVVHRDIKPENILLDKQGQVKIADFGLAKVLGPEHSNVTLTQEGHIMGTPHYMAPEQVEHPKDVDHRADIYSLGVVFYEMLTGELPMGKFQPPSQKVQVDVRLDEVVLKTLSKEPQLRYQKVSQVGVEVETIVHSKADRTLGDVATIQSKKGKAPFVQILEVLQGSEFTSPLAIRLIKLSALGFLAFLAFLGNLPIPGMKICFLFAGFAGCFGLIGFAGMVESWEQYKQIRNDESATPKQRQLLKRRFIISVIPIFLILLIVAMIALYAIDSFLNTSMDDPIEPELTQSEVGSNRVSQGRQEQQAEDDLALLQTQTQSPFVARLPQGTVELISICEHPSDGIDWWSADGSPVQDMPVFLSSGLLDPEDGMQRREFVLRFKDLPADASWTGPEIDQARSTSGSRVRSLDGRYLTDFHVAAALLPKTLTSTNLTVGVASGQWDTLVELDGHSNMSQSAEWESDRWSISSMEAIQVGSDVRMGLAYSGGGDYQMRVVAMVSSGIHEAKAVMQNPTSTITHITYEFVDLSLEEVKSFEVQIRPYEWVEYKNVSLVRNHPTAVHIKHASPETSTVVIPGVKGAPKEVQSILQTLHGWWDAGSKQEYKASQEYIVPTYRQATQSFAKNVHSMIKAYPGWEFSIVSLYWENSTALAVSKILKPHNSRSGKSHVFLFTLIKQDGAWLIGKMDWVKLEDFEVEKKRFLENHPGIHIWNDDSIDEEYGLL